ncbi:MAG: AAA family ATPase, partial [Nanoarchaeota archaeon]|nr:AAA family ATPase [Nanoarchaeota archaeon]
GLYERVEGGAWVNKKTGQPYMVKDEVYRRELTNYSFDDPKVQEHLAKGGNIGYLCGSNKIYVFDLDNKELLNEFEAILGETLTIETAKGYHLYFEYDELLYKIIFEKNGVHLGELMGIGQQVLTPPSIHPSGKEYSVFKDLPIVKLTPEKLEIIKNKFTDDDRVFKIQSPDWNRYQDLSGLNITSILPNLNLFKKYGNEFYGVHPIHGSTTGMNFFVNPIKNLWHCFRHDSGGDALSLLSMLEGICNCEDFRKEGKKLRGEDFIQAIEIAKSKYHLEIKAGNNFNEVNINNSSFEIKVISAKRLLEMDIPIPSWIVEGWIPEESIVIIAGKTGAMKSFLANVMGFCSVYGKDFLGKFATKKGIWLYIDEENPLRLTKDRTEKILAGLEVEAPNDFKFICHSGIKLDIDEHITALEEIIKEYKPNVVVLDSLVRFLSKTDENSAKDISNIFSKLRNLSSRYKTSFFIIHHL